MQNAKQAERCIEEIRRLAGTFDQLSGPFEKDIDADAEQAFDKFKCWVENNQ